MPADVYLDPVTHDWVFDARGQLRLTGLTEEQSPDGVDSRGEAVAQRFKVRTLTDVGEWAYDLAYGVPYSTEILGARNARLGLLRARLVAIAHIDPEIRSVQRMDLTLNPLTRLLTIAATLITIYGRQEIEFQAAA